MKKFSVFALAALLGAGAFFAGADVSLAQSASNDAAVCTQWQIDQGFCEGSFRNTVLTALNFFLGFLALLTTGILLYGGFLYITSAGNDENVEKAKKLIMYAAIGIIVIFMAFAIVNTLLGIDTGNDQTGV